jgi:XTP/dITP diphosphohydrolase
VAEIALATSSKRKQSHFAALAEKHGITIVLVAPPTIELQDMSVSATARKKAEELALRGHDMPVIVDDFGVEVDALKGFPGALVRPILDQGGLALLEQVTIAAAERRRLRCALQSAVAMVVGGEVYVEEGKLPGQLDFRLVEAHDAKAVTDIFHPDGSDKTLTEREASEGFGCHLHRAQAFDRVVARWRAGQ